MLMNKHKVSRASFRSVVVTDDIQCTYCPMVRIIVRQSLKMIILVQNPICSVGNRGAVRYMVPLHVLKFVVQSILSTDLGIEPGSGKMVNCLLL